PGDTAVGRNLREILLDPATGDLDLRAEALLMAADRAHHVARVIRPALDAGRDVVCDRYVASSVAYQGYGRDLGPERIRALSLFATDGLEPDVIVLLEVPEAVAAERLDAMGKPDRLESAGIDFHQRVADGYRAQAVADPTRWVRVDGTGTIADVADRIDAVLSTRADAATAPGADR